MRQFARAEIERVWTPSSSNRLAVAVRSHGEQALELLVLAHATSGWEATFTASPEAGWTAGFVADDATLLIIERMSGSKKAPSLLFLDARTGAFISREDLAWSSVQAFALQRDGCEFAIAPTHRLVEVWTNSLGRLVSALLLDRR